MKQRGTEFIKGLKPRVLGQLLEQIFQKMKIAGEAGSLLRIEEEIDEAIEEAREEFNKELLRRKQASGSLFPELEKSKQTSLFDFADLPDKTTFWDTAEQKIINSLMEYVTYAETRNGSRRMLFAKDTVRGFAFIDICRKSFDVVVMNPPFGQPTDKVFEYQQKNYRGAHNDIYASFVRRALQFAKNGCVGAITSRSFLLSPRLESLRVHDILPKIRLLLDFGLGVMDGAYVESIAYILDQAYLPVLYGFDLKKNAPNHDSDKVLLEINKDPIISLRDWFAKLPNSKLLYSIPYQVRTLLNSDLQFEPNYGTAREGMKSFNNERYLRLWWEVHSDKIGVRKRWNRLAKGGRYSFYYSDIPLLLNWYDEGAELRETNRQINGSSAQVRQASSYWYNPGATYSKRSVKGFSSRALPKDAIFTSNGPAVLPFGENTPELMVGWLNSKLVRSLIHLQANFADYSTGAIKKLPWFKKQDPDRITEIENASKKLINTTQLFNSQFETCTIFGTKFTELLSRNQDTFRNYLNGKTNYYETFVSLIDEAVHKLYDVSSIEWADDILTIEDDDKNKLHNEINYDLDYYKFYRGSALVSYLIGCNFGRWDIRYASEIKEPPPLPDPFKTLPTCPPGMLQNKNGLPVSPIDVDSDYPLAICWDGILVDDEGHQKDIVGQIRTAIFAIWGKKAEQIEQEICNTLNVSSLRKYFSTPNRFFAKHLKEYTESRRQAPIYWLISTASGGYKMWLYYNRLNDQTIYKCINDYIEPKLSQISEALTDLRNKFNRNPQDEQNFEKLSNSELEIRDLRNELVRIAKFWKPNFNDGVEITAAPLWRFVPHRPWQRRLKQTWEKMKKGDFDWAHLAYSIWPDRVIRASHKNRSFAIAHDLESDLWEEIENGTDRQGNPKYKWVSKDLNEKDLKTIIMERSKGKT